MASGTSSLDHQTTTDKGRYVVLPPARRASSRRARVGDTHRLDSKGRPLVVSERMYCSEALLRVHALNRRPLTSEG